jgi:hypothetical protein
VPPSTRQILAEKALDMECGQTCVDWAAGLLESGSDSVHLAMLAGMTPPLNHFEVAGRRDRALAELGIVEVSKSDAVRAWAAEYLRQAWDGGADRRTALRKVSALCVSNDYLDELFEFHLLDCAWDDLDEAGVASHWPSATAETIEDIVEERIRALTERPGSQCRPQMSDGGPRRHACPCCGTSSLHAPGSYEICGTCGWEDDPVQRADANYRGGANTGSLAEAKRQWRKGESANPLRHVGWLAICVWLLLCIAGESVHLARWVVEKDSPNRHELLLGASLAAIWATPAILLVVILSWISGVERGSPLPRRAAQLLAAVATMIWTAALLAGALS